MKLAAVDIGSNAIRFQVSTVLDSAGKGTLKKLEYIRFPLRLGHDVFSTGRISDKSIAKFIKLMRAFKLLLELYEVTDYMFCATSAMRESDNGADVVKRVYEELGLTIDVIDGNREAELINKAIASYLVDKTYLHIDVGGGSTELNLYVQGKKTKTRSFKIGSVRVLENTDSPVIWENMQSWVVESLKSKPGRVTAVGTGGNISKIFELAKQRPGKTITLRKIKSVQSLIESHSIDDRIYKLQMNPDRADVIVPAGKIYVKVMEWAKASSMLVPEVGLKDGMMLYLYELNTRQTKLFS
ncbi:phosphatase [Chryseolinea sp. T2]|uniref:Ppx/GppA phosphatase family protein n=1 Tax=Chryseolinea sp. T2 TaxID=3129255 RepID=UPI0030772AD5